MDDESANQKSVISQLSSEKEELKNELDNYKETSK